MGPIQGINLYYYDMRECENGANLSSLLIDWMKRKVGLVRANHRDDTFEFTVLAKKDLNQPYMVHMETPIYPECRQPNL